MRLNTLIACAALCTAATLSTTVKLEAQTFATHACGESSDDHGFLAHFFNGEQVCEVRSTSFPLVGGHLNVSGQNGSIEVIGEDRQDIALEARVGAHAPSQSEAASILHEITIATGATVEAHGPRASGNRNWSVSYKLRVPHRLAANFHTMNGSLSLVALNGAIRGETTNGSLSFDHLAGDVNLTTTNGGINARLDGSAWQGAGLSATTTNGGINVSAPAHYSAHLVANTINGSTSIDLPGAEQSGVHRRSIDTKLGSGGPTLSFETTNGGISIR
jgi:hypothetical protein